jgi:glycosyltransferase involved in cell wall biosynthesis
MPEVYNALDIYVLASYREGYPRSAMEASAMGLPLVASDVRGCRQVVVDGETGYLFRVGDAEALAQSVSRLVADPALRTRVGAAARAKAVVDFDDRCVIATTLRTYDWLLASQASLARADAVR